MSKDSLNHKLLYILVDCFTWKFKIHSSTEQLFFQNPLIHTLRFKHGLCQPATNYNPLPFGAVPYPGRSHINPMMNFYKLLASRKHNILITFTVTEDWLGFIGSDTKSNNTQFASIPNVIPTELARGADFPGFYEAVMTKMESPFDQLLDQLELPVTTIIADTELLWAIHIGHKRSIPVATLCTVSATVFSILHFDHMQNKHILVNLLDHGDELVDDIQGISPKHISDLRTTFCADEQRIVQLTLECISLVSKAQYLIFNSVYEIEPQVFDSLKAKFHVPIYPIGPAIPQFELTGKVSAITGPNSPNYIQWLDSQPAGSVLYVSFGSFLPLSSDQMDEIAAGLGNSGVRYMWVRESCGDRGMLVPWCDQLMVLCHSSVGGFWTHCGWNSTLETVLAGIPMLTFPLFFDQVPNSKQIVENRRIGWNVKKDVEAKILVTRDEIMKLVQRFMDIENNEGKKLRTRAKKLQELCEQAIAKGSSSDKNLDAFIRDIS